MFTNEFFAGNRRRLLKLLDHKLPIIVTANGLLQRNADTTFKFRQDSSFWYLTGITQPDIVLVMDGDDEYLIVPGRDVVREAFDGVVSVETLVAQSGVQEVLDEARGWQRLNKRLRRTKQLATLDAAPMYIEQHGMYVNPARARLLKNLRDDHPAVDVQDIRHHLAVQRSLKQPLEIDAIRRAIAATADGLEVVTSPERLATYAYEYEAEADLSREFRRLGFDHAFTPIVASGARACQLHYVENSGPVNQDQLMIFDVGAEVDMYAADITRTVIVGEPTARQRQVFSAVREVQDFALSQLKPDVELGHYEKAVEAMMGEQLQALGLVKKPDHAAIRRYYPHATSHFMGLDVHDTGDYRLPLQPGNVLTCEPGIYIPEEGIGVRIEDDVLITNDGCEVLSSSLSSDLD